MGHANEVQRLERQILAGKERRQSYLWQARALLAAGLMLTLMLVAAHFNWVPLLGPMLVIGLTIAAICLAIAGYHLIRSFIVRPPATQEAANLLPLDHEQQDS
jgi:hypothetical protein